MLIIELSFDSLPSEIFVLKTSADDQYLLAGLADGDIKVSSTINDFFNVRTDLSMEDWCLSDNAVHQ